MEEFSGSTEDEEAELVEGSAAISVLLLPGYPVMQKNALIKITPSPNKVIFIYKSNKIILII